VRSPERHIPTPELDAHDIPHITTRPLIFRGRGAVTQPDGRFESQRREAADDGWDTPYEQTPAPRTELLVDTSKTVISRNQSPDVGFSQSINPYRGCEHGCTYCFARPTHSYLGLSAGLDFETRIAYKPDAVAQLRRELAKPGYQCSPIALGINTDGWQPVERKLGITRALLEVLAECRHPVTIVTKSALIAERDVDLLAQMARDGLAEVAFSITTLDKKLALGMEPRAAAPHRRLEAMRILHEAGVPVSVLFAPLIPALNDHELEAVVEAAHAAGAHAAGYVLLRLPHELAEIFPAWLRQYAPGRAEHVLSLLRQMHGGELYRSGFGIRMRGDGVFAQMYSKRMRLLAERLGLNKRRYTLDTGAFRPPRPDTPQMDLF
jgi:DNA repair photolyase